MEKKDEREAEFERILEKFSESIRAQVLSSPLLRSGVELEDILQEIRARLWKKLGSEKKMAHLSSYIKKVVRSVVVDEVRKARTEERLLRRAIEEEKGVWMSPSGKEPEREDLGLDLEKALGSLLESRRRAVKLFLFGLTVEEIAMVFHWSEDKTRNLVYRGLADIKKGLPGKGGQDEK